MKTYSKTNLQLENDAITDAATAATATDLKIAITDFVVADSSVYYTPTDGSTYSWTATVV